MRASSLALALLLATASVAHAGGPRFVTGPPFFTAPAGEPIGWRPPQLLYFTDPAALSPHVNHAAADALVARAAAVWNVPVASISVARGGTLAQHVSGANTYLDPSGLIFPADTTPANAANIPLAVLYDSDGSLTDLLLGAGASDPSGCRQNAVTESVDAFDPDGHILHAILILNGRCTAAAPEAQLELQYQLERAFGRVLGLAWSQANDNVFTGSPIPTQAQAANWPILHPLDIICGLYAYQCLPNPFQLRPDDIASLVSVYPVTRNPAPGKQCSLCQANAVVGNVTFPTGEGMAGVNVLVRRESANSTVFDLWDEASAITGALFRRAATSPFVAPPGTPAASLGSTSPDLAGRYRIAYIPIDDNLSFQNLSIFTEPVNPLYRGTHSLGPYAPGPVLPSGTSVSQITLYSSSGGPQITDFVIADASPTCGAGDDGSAAAPSPIPASGLWNGLLCPFGHTSFRSAAVRPGRTFTVEVTALDEQGNATNAKLMPVIGLFTPDDAPGDLPSLAVAPSAFQGRATGMTSLTAATASLSSLRLGIADQRGEGRPDFAFHARFLYADTLIPAQLPLTGGPLTITGFGFHPGNTVSVNGIAAAVLSLTANAIVVQIPAAAALHATDGTAIDLTVNDLVTGAITTATAALTLTSSPSRPNTLRLIATPTSPAYDGDPGSPFTVQLVAPDGTTPVAGQPISFTVAAGSAILASANSLPCGTPVCTLATDASGLATILATPTAEGAITLQATGSGLIQSASFTALAQAGSLQIWMAPTGNHPVGLDAGVIALVDHAPDGSRLANRSITFSFRTGTGTFSACSLSTCQVASDSTGSVVIRVTPTSLGAITIQARDGDRTQTTAFNAVSNTDQMTITHRPAKSTYLDNSPGQFEISLLQADGISPDFNQTVIFTAPPQVTLYPCRAHLCSVSTGWTGRANVGIDVSQPGTYAIQASFGSEAQLVTASVTFTIKPHTLAFKLLTAPSGSLPIGQPASIPFVVQLLQDDLIPVANSDIALAVSPGAASLSVCRPWEFTCRTSTDSNGMASTTVTPLAPGLVTLTAAYPPDILTATFTAVGTPQTMSILQQPTGDIFVGDTIQFAVQVLAAGTRRPIPNDVVQFAFSSGSFGFSDWFSTTPNRQTDANGIASEVGIPAAPGPITLTASDGLTSQTITFVARPRLDHLHLLSAPASGTPVGIPSPIPFAFQVFLSDGITPASSRAVTLAITSGTAGFSSCLNPAPCVLVTDANGLVSTAVTPLSGAPITLSATEAGVQLTASFTPSAQQIRPDQWSITSTDTPVYLAESAVLALSFSVTVTRNGSPVSAQPVTWTATSALFPAATTLTESSGTTSNLLLVGPLLPAANPQTTVDACVQPPVPLLQICSHIHIYAVPDAAFQLSFLAGAAQTVTSPTPYALVIFQVHDASGHPVASAPVSIYQTVTALDAPCPDRGRCPASAILASRAIVLLSAPDGTVTLTPLSLSGSATHTEIEASSGRFGAITTVLTAKPLP